MPNGEHHPTARSLLAPTFFENRMFDNILVAFWPILLLCGSMLAPLGRLLVPFWMILASFWTLFGSFWCEFAHFGKCSMKFGIDFRKCVFQNNTWPRNHKPTNQPTTNQQRNKLAWRDAHSRFGQTTFRCSNAYFSSLW